MRNTNLQITTEGDARGARLGLPLSAAVFLKVQPPRDEIRSSGLWNVNYVGGPYSPAFLDVFERHVG